MNCPNCNEKPLGILPSFSLNGVSFKEKFRGYFRCKNCGTLLKTADKIYQTPEEHSCLFGPL